MKRRIRWDRVLFIFSATVFVAATLIYSICMFVVIPNKMNELNEKIESLRSVEEVCTDEVEDVQLTTSLGEFKLTAYCNCEKCNGVWAWGPTASGTMPEEGRTVAVDSNVIPLGTHLLIDGVEYIAEDTGSAIVGNRIDVFVSDHDRCFEDQYNKTAYVEVIY